jgi:hypothetical protein
MFCRPARDFARLVLPVAVLLTLSAVYASAATLRVCASSCAYSNVQLAINDAVPGDTILLRAGETFTGNFILRAKSSSSTAYITIRSDASDSVLPAPGVRLVPEGRPAANVSLSSLARIVGLGGAAKSTPVLRAEQGAHHYRLQFIRFDGTAQVGYETLIAFGTDDPQSNPPHDIVLDRVYIHGHPTKGQKRGISLNGRAIEVSNSYIANIKAVNADSQALGGWNGAGPFKIINNYLEAAGENVMFGGAWPASSGLIPSNIEIRRNHITKPVAWRNPILSTPGSVRAAVSSTAGSLAGGTHYFKVVAILKTGTRVAVSAPSSEVYASVSSGRSVTVSWGAVSGAEGYRIYRGTSSGGQSRYIEVAGSTTSFLYKGSGEISGTPPTRGTKWVSKNLIELKNAQRVVIDGNVIENNWAGDQAGYAIVLTPRNYNGVAPWSAVRDVTITNNIIRHSAGAINILGYDDTESTGSALTERIVVRNNLFEDIDPASWGGGLTKCFLVGQGASEVTFDRNTILHGTTTIVSAYGKPMPKFVFTNNVTIHGKYGVMGGSSSPGNPTLKMYFPSAVFTGNVLAGGNPSLYPPGNSFPSIAAFNASFVDVESGDYRILASSSFYSAGAGGTTPGTNFTALYDAQSIPDLPPPSTPPPPAGNRAPTADAGGPYTAQAGQSLTVSGADSTDPENAIVTYRWHWGDDVVLHASDVAAQDLHGNWQRGAVQGAAGGVALINPNLGAAKVQTALASPSSYVELRFHAAAGVPYYVWFRMRAENDHYSNDSVYVQFNDAVDASGDPYARIGTTSAWSAILEQGRDDGVSGWGWTDMAYDATAPPVYFATSGMHTIRLQAREDGARIDQIVISSRTYAARRPGLTQADTTIVSRTLGTSTGIHATHTYTRSGIYPVTLMVTDDEGLSDVDTTTATVQGGSEPEPQAFMQEPAAADQTGGIRAGARVAGAIHIEREG